MTDKTDALAALAESRHVRVLRELRDTGDVSDWRAMETALTAAIEALAAPAASVDVLGLRDLAALIRYRYATAVGRPPAADLIAMVAADMTKWADRIDALIDSAGTAAASTDVDELEKVRQEAIREWEKTAPFGGMNRQEACRVGMRAVIAAINSAGGAKCKHQRTPEQVCDPCGRYPDTPQPDGDALRATDLRHLIVMDAQFAWRGSTELRAEEIERLSDRKWVQEGHENGEFAITDAGRDAIVRALASRPSAAAVVDEAMARRLDDYLGGEFDIRIGKQAAHAALTAALANPEQQS